MNEILEITPPYPTELQKILLEEDLKWILMTSGISKDLIGRADE